MTQALSAQHAAGNEAVIEGQKRALELAVHGAPLAAVLEALVRTIEVQSTNGVIGSILLRDGTHLRHGAAPSLPGDYCKAIDGIDIGPGIGSCGSAAFHAKTVVVSDIANDPLWSAFKELALRHELRACWSTPILSSANDVLGTFALYHRVPTVPSERDREIVELLGHTAALVIERDLNARAREDADRKLRASLEQQMARIGSLFELAPVGIAVMTGPEHRFELANPAYRHLVGGREVAGRTLREALPELEGQGFDTLLDNVRATAKPYIGRAQRVLLARGDQLDEAFVDFVYQPVLGADQAVENILVVAFDVTALARARMEAEQARQRAETSEHGLRTFIDNLPALAWTAQPDGTVDYYNQRWYEYTGTTFEQMQGWGWQAVQDPERLPEVVARWKQSLETGDPFEMEMLLRGGDGIPRWFLTRVVPERDAGGRIVRWLGTNTNIDDLKAAHALTEAMAQQSRDVEHALLQLREQKDRAERRVSELENRSA